MKKTLDLDVIPERLVTPQERAAAVREIIAAFSDHYNRLAFDGMALHVESMKRIEASFQ